ncbi:MAG TPA: DUF2975 domain-containing protein [Longimicrobiales bacterium]
MADPKTGTLYLARRVIRALIVLNWMAGGFILVLLVGSMAFDDLMMNALTQGRASPRLTAGMRAIMVLGLLSVLVINVVLTRLSSIVDTVRAGDPFTLINAGRLRTIALALAWLEILHVFIGLIATGVSTKSVPLEIEWGISITRWLAVLLLFVLAQVFEHGASMRADLEGTI